MSIATTENRATRQALDALYVPISDTAIQIGRQGVLGDHNLLSAWIDQQDDIREPSDYFGPISTPEVLRMVTNPAGCTDAQLRAACELLAERFLSDNEDEVQRLALRAMEA